MTSFVVLVILLTALCSLALTVGVRALAVRVGFTDEPDNHRKLHPCSTPLGGGLAIFITVPAVIAALVVIPNPWRADLVESSRELVTLWLAGAVIVAVGLIDDRFHLSGKRKLLGQCLAAMVLVAGGITIECVESFGFQFEFGSFSGIVTVIWLVGAINAINLLDGIDGLATTLGLILTSSIAIISAMFGNTAVSVIAIVFAASLLGFLRFNLPPASIFLGDAGSMLIGLIVGALAIQGSLKGPGTVLLAAPLACWTVPFFDSAAAILRRKLMGRSIYDPDRAHLHHRMTRRFGSSGKALGWLAFSCGITALAALISVAVKSDWVAVICVVAVVATFVMTRLFGYVEFLLVLAEVREFGRSFFRRASRGDSLKRQGVVRLHGHRRWELFWEALTDAADRLELVQLKVYLNLPAMDEEFYATWRRDMPAGMLRHWKLELPLFVHNQAVGKLLVVGQSNFQGACQALEALLAKIEPLDSELLRIAEEADPSDARARASKATVTFAMATEPQNTVESPSDTGSY